MLCENSPPHNMELWIRQICQLTKRIPARAESGALAHFLVLLPVLFLAFLVAIVDQLASRTGKNGADRFSTNSQNFVAAVAILQRWSVAHIEVLRYGQVGKRGCYCGESLCSCGEKNISQIKDRKELSNFAKQRFWLVPAACSCRAAVGPPTAAAGPAPQDLRTRQSRPPWSQDGWRSPASPARRCVRSAKTRGARPRSSLSDPPRWTPAGAEIRPWGWARAWRRLRRARSCSNDPNRLRGSSASTCTMREK